MIDHKMKPRNGHTYQIGIVARISGCQGQKEVSLEDQIDHGKEEARQYCDGGLPVNYRTISTKGKGESLDRPELDEIETMLRSGGLDLLVVEDLGRLVRGTEASRLCGIAVDHKVRVIAPNDCIDTADPNWEEDVIGACRDHVGHNAHTSKRLKHKMKNRFVKMGASMARPIYGYSVPKDAKTYNDWLKDETATAVLLELFRRYKAYSNFSVLADWLNKTGVPTGPYDRTKRWDSAKVRRLMSNPLLKGLAWRGSRHTVKHHETGRRISVKNPAGPVYYSCPQLAHVPEILWDEVNEIRQIRNRGLGRKPVDGNDPRAGITRKRTVFPGQHARCGICGRFFYWGGHGKKSGMMCSGVREYQCWNAMSFNGYFASKAIMLSVIQKLEELPEFDATLLEKLNQEAESMKSQSSTKLVAAEQELHVLMQRIGRLVDAISQTGLDDDLQAKLLDLKTQRFQLQQLVQTLKEVPGQAVTIPPMASLKQRVGDALQKLAGESPEFGQLMNRVITDLKVYPYRICDGNRIVMRAQFIFNLVPFVGASVVPGEAEAVLRHEMTVDLFEPPQRVQYRERVVYLQQSGVAIKEAARQLGITQVAAQNAIKLHRFMEEQGIRDPFVAMREPPADDTKMKRHLHPRYDFHSLGTDQPA